MRKKYIITTTRQRIPADVGIKWICRLKKSEFFLKLTFWARFPALEILKLSTRLQEVCQRGIPLTTDNNGPGFSPPKIQIAFRRWSNIQQSSLTGQGESSQGYNNPLSSKSWKERVSTRPASSSGGSLYLCKEQSLPYPSMQANTEVDLQHWVRLFCTSKGEEAAPFPEHEPAPSQSAALHVQPPRTMDSTSHCETSNTPGFPLSALIGLVKKST